MLLFKLKSPADAMKVNIHLLYLHVSSEKISFAAVGDDDPAGTPVGILQTGSMSKKMR